MKERSDEMKVDARRLVGLLPPWLEYPDYKPGCLGFRMGPGEDYMDKWRENWSKISSCDKAEFISICPPPKGWERYLPNKPIK